MVTINSGGLADSRLAKLIEVEETPVNTNENNPSPPIADETSTSVHLPTATGPDVPKTAGEYPGAFA